MRIIDDKTNKSNDYPKRITCDFCGSVFEYDRNDIKDGMVKCPCCSEELVLSSTTSTLKYPNDFYSFTVSDGGVVMSDEEINKEIQRLIKALHSTPDVFDWMYTGSGVNLIFAIKRPDESTGAESYEVIVANEYHQIEDVEYDGANKGVMKWNM